MATKSTKTTKRGPASSFYEIVMNGPHDLAHGYMTGLIQGSGHAACYYDGPSEGVSDLSLKSRTKQFLHILPHENHFIVDNKTRSLLKRNLDKMHEQTGLELISERRILKAHFTFTFMAWASAYIQQINALLKTLPRGLKLVNYSFKENIDKSAKGAEGYAPLHDYEVAGSGEVRGRIDLVIAARHIVLSHPLIEADSIELELGA